MSGQRDADEHLARAGHLHLNPPRTEDWQPCKQQTQALDRHPLRDIGRSMYRNESPVPIGLFYASPLSVSTLPWAHRHRPGGQVADE